MFIYCTKDFVNKFSDFIFFIDFKFYILVGFFISLFISLCFCKFLIFVCKKLNFYQIIRDDVYHVHFKKQNIPTMGGLIIIVSILLSVIMYINVIDCYFLYLLFILLGYGVLGFIDDCYKIFYKNSIGLHMYWKYFWQSLITIIFIYLIFVFEERFVIYRYNICIINNIYKFFFNYLYDIILIYLTIVGFSNAVNLTDGLDGLAIISIILISIGFFLVSCISYDVGFSSYFKVPYIDYSNQLLLICVSIIGGSLGFFYFNFPPAKIFMGDIGSLSLGGCLGAISVLLHQEYLLFIVGGICIIEVISVVLQVLFFRFRGKRLFLMTPIHHHYELKGYNEYRIVMYACILSCVFLLIGIMHFCNIIY